MYLNTFDCSKCQFAVYLDVQIEQKEEKKKPKMDQTQVGI